MRDLIEIFQPISGSRIFADRITIGLIGAPTSFPYFSITLWVGCQHFQKWGLICCKRVKTSHVNKKIKMIKLQKQTQNSQQLARFLKWMPTLFRRLCLHHNFVGKRIIPKSKWTKHEQKVNFRICRLKKLIKKQLARVKNSEYRLFVG